MSGLLMIVEQQESSDTSLGTSARPLGCTVPVIFMLLIQVLVLHLVAIADGSGFIRWSELYLLLLRDLSEAGVYDNNGRKRG